MPLLISLAALLALLYLLRFCYRGPSWPKTWVKTTSVALLAVVAFVTGGPPWLGLALALCAAGDWFLSRGTEATFMAGVGAFAAGHLAFAVAFLSHSEAAPSRILSSAMLPLALGLVLFGVVMALVLFRRAGALRYAVAAYVPVILTMALAALALPPVGALALVLPSALLFLTSDTVLASEEFLIPPGHRLHRLTPFIVWPTYWLAQLGFLLALSGPGLV